MVQKALSGLTPLARRALDDMLLQAFEAREAAAKQIERFRAIIAGQERVHELANASFVELCVALDVSGPETPAYLQGLCKSRTEEFVEGKPARPWIVSE